MIKIGRCINGISINGLEFLLDKENGDIMLFNNIEEAKNYLIKNGIDNCDLEYFEYVENIEH